MANMNTRLIVSAEDRGATRLLRRMGTEADSAVDKFGKLGTSITAAIGGFTAGYGVKTALGWIDEYKMDVMSVATMLTDTVRGSGKDIAKVFQQNQIHAEAFFKVLRTQAMQSIATFDDLRSAYAIFTAKGLALEATQQQAKSLSDLVDRITLATRGQNQNIQVPQELRAILQGTARPVDTVAKMFIERDANFQQTIKKIVSEGRGDQVIDYLGGLLADVPIAKSIGEMLRKQLSNVRDAVRMWAQDAFLPLYDEITDIVNKIVDAITGGDSPLLSGVESLVKSLTNAVKVSADFFSGFARSEFGKFLMEAAPQLLAVATAATVAARAFGLLKAAAVASMTGAGAIALAVGGIVSAGSWAESQVSSQKADEMWKSATTDKEKKIAIAQQDRSFYADKVDDLSSLITGIASAIPKMFGLIIDLFKSVLVAIQAAWFTTIADVKEIFARVYLSFDKVTNWITEVFQKVYFGFEGAWKGIASKINYAIGWWISKMPFGGESAKSSSAEFYRNSEQYKMESDLAKQNFANVDLSGSGYSKDAVDFYNKSVNSAAETRERAKVYASKMDDLFRQDWMQPINSMLDTWEAKKKARQAVGLTTGDPETLDTSAIVGTGSSQKAADDIEKELKEYQKNLAKLAKDSAGLDAVMAQLESATLKGGDSLEYALSQVSKEYANYKAKIAKLAGGQDVMSEIDSRIVTEKNLQVELEKKIKDAKDEELALLQKQLAESKSKMTGLYSKAQIDLTEQVQKKQLDALKLAEQFYTEQRRIRTVGEADKLSDKVFNIQGMLAGVGGRGELSDFLNQKKFEALEIQKQLSDLHRDNDLFGGSESEIQAQERINGLKAQYLELYRQTSEEMEIQRAKAEYMASLAEENTIASGFMAGMQDIADGVTSTFTHIRTLTVETFGSMQNIVSNVFFDFFSGELDSAKDYFAAFVQSILQAFSDMLAKMLVEYITTTMTMKSIGGMLSGIFGALGGIGSIGGFAAGATTTQLGGVSASQAVTLTAANGGVFPGGFQAFAGGGIVNQPTLGLVGEGRYNEAVVPLPDGRSIPVNMRGGGTSVVVNVIDNTGGEVKKSVNKEIDEQGNMVIDIVLDALARNRKGARSQFKTALGVA